MPRPLRPIDDGLIYHVINRRNNRQREKGVRTILKIVLTPFLPFLGGGGVGMAEWSRV
jgi:hypothetical protein